MPLNQIIDQDLKDAMKAKDGQKVSCLRLLKASIKNVQVEKRRELKDEEIKAIISSAIRKGKEAAEEFRKGGRDELAIKEEAELQILYQYLPQQLSGDEIEDTLKGIISDLKAESPKDLGKVMKVAMAKMAGQAEGKEVNVIARKLLN